MVESSFTTVGTTSRNGFHTNLSQSLDHAVSTSLVDSRHHHGPLAGLGRHDVESGRLTDECDESLWTRSTCSRSRDDGRLVDEPAHLCMSPRCARWVIIALMSVSFPEPTVPLQSRTDVFVGYLDYFRSRVINKIEGLPENALRHSRRPSDWTPVELLKHLT